MSTNINTDSTAFTRLLDDLLWLHARGNRDDGLREAAEAMIADYTDDPNRYSDGSEVWEWYQEFPGCYFATKGELHLPPHRRTTTSDKHIYGYGFLAVEPSFRRARSSWIQEQESKATGSADGCP